MMHIINKSGGKLVLPGSDITLKNHGDVEQIDEEIANSREVQALVKGGWAELKNSKSVLKNNAEAGKPLLVFEDDPSKGFTIPANEIKVEDLGETPAAITEVETPTKKAEKAKKVISE